MTLNRRVSIWAGLRYKGKLGMANWIVHRITGLGIVLFVGIHVGMGFLGQQFADDTAFAINAIYESWGFQLFVYFSVLFHAFNGSRLALMDIFPGLIRFQSEMIWLQWLIFIPVYGLPSFIMLQNTLTGV
jgi:succinate dehydrogenase / fumarate reductase, cytochrome b subunit